MLNLFFNNIQYYVTIPNVMSGSIVLYSFLFWFEEKC
jgi:hypothetical protein